MVAPVGGSHPHLTMSGVTSSGSRVQGTDFTPHHFKSFSSHEHFQQVSLVCVVRVC